MTLADGCFDPLHIGHVRYLRVGAKHGRPLSVRIAPDADIRGKGRNPFQSQQERAETIMALDMVDRVVMDATLAEAILRVKPATLVKGIEWTHRLPLDVLKACQAVGTRIVYVSERHRTSTARLTALSG